MSNVKVGSASAPVSLYRQLDMKSTVSGMLNLDWGFGPMSSCDESTGKNCKTSDRESNAFAIRGHIGQETVWTLTGFSCVHF